MSLKLIITKQLITRLIMSHNNITTTNILVVSAHVDPSNYCQSSRIWFIYCGTGATFTFAFQAFRWHTSAE